MKSTCSTINSPQISPVPEFTRKAYKRTLNPRVLGSPITLPPVYSPQPKRDPISSDFIPSKLYNSRKTLQEKLSLYIDLGLTPNIPLSHKNLIKFKNAKKKTITLSDFMSKSAKQQLIESSTLSEIKDESINYTPKVEKMEVKNSNKLPNISSLTNSRSFNEISLCESRSFKGKSERNRGEDLKKIEKIVGSCEDLLKMKFKAAKELGKLND